mmetsp:Transcript_26277/g.60690  ORF Transcript_26277/g.60690 Transcript_26277/m.60690 type:complete len:81 (-) Transcript_26277:203-445(-)
MTPRSVPLHQWFSVSHFAVGSPALLANRSTRRKYTDFPASVRRHSLVGSDALSTQSSALLGESQPVKLPGADGQGKLSPP